MTTSLLESSKKIRNSNHPRLGTSIKVEPIRTIESINAIKQLLAPSPRNAALFIVGINTGFRASELLSIQVGQVRHLQPGDRLEVKQRKNRKYRAVTLNNACVKAIHKLLTCLEDQSWGPGDTSWIEDDAFLFPGREANIPLSVSTLNNLMKGWCRTVNLKGNYGSHTLRKTWGYMQRTQLDTPIPLLMTAFGHASQQHTLTYLCIQDKEIESIYISLEL